MANRTPTQPTAEFEGLCDQRDDVAVKLSLLMETHHGKTAEIAELRVKIFELDKRIKTAWKGPLP